MALEWERARRLHAEMRCAALATEVARLHQLRAQEAFQASVAVTIRDLNLPAEATLDLDRGVVSGRKQPAPLQP